MTDILQKQYAARAFVSCSLREMDKPFVDYIENILLYYNIEPFGTVGRYSESIISRNILPGPTDGN